MRYALLICTDENWYASLPDEQLQAFYEEYGKFMAEMSERGVLEGGERLRPTSDSTTVRVTDGQTLTADGPFAETKEQLGGFYLVNCANLDEAIEIAAKIPAARHGTIEVRPVWEM
jgi:hypothetical protein